MNRRVALLWLPLGLFVALASAFVLGLRRPEGQTVASQMVGVAVPDFALPPALPGRPALAAADLRGQGPHLVNFFASWCVPCAAEAPALARLAADHVPIVGIAVRDRPDALDRFLRRSGDPYRRIGADDHGRVQIAFGSSGVPETFVVDGQGTIRLQVIGPIGAQQLADIRAALRS